MVLIGVWRAVCACGLNVAVGRAGKKKKKNGNWVPHYPDMTSSASLTQGNTFLCYYTVCIHIDPLHHSLYGNVNNGWRSAIAGCTFACLLLSGTHSCLTCNFLCRWTALHSTAIHFYPAVALPGDAESCSRSTFDTVNILMAWSVWIWSWKTPDYLASLHWLYQENCILLKTNCDMTVP